jgi:hypothetical protein
MTDLSENACDECDPNRRTCPLVLATASSIAGLSFATRRGSRILAVAHRAFHIPIAALSLDTLDRIKSSKRCMFGLEKIDAHAPDRADPAPFPRNQKNPNKLRPIDIR